MVRSWFVINSYELFISNIDKFLDLSNDENISLFEKYIEEYCENIIPLEEVLKDKPNIKSFKIRKENR